MVEDLNAEEEGQTDIKEADILPDGARGFLRQCLVSMQPYADSHPLYPEALIWFLF